MVRNRFQILSYVFLAVKLLCGGGCEQPRPTAQQLQQGLVFMFPGIEGGYWSMGPARRALRDSNFDGAILTHKWDHSFSPLGNLTDYQANRRAARRVASEISSYHRQFPNQKIDLLGYSGGGGLAVMVAEELPPDVRLRNLALVHSAVSCNYDLTAAISHIDGRLINFHSDKDWLILGLGTTIFGTIDRKNDPSAGKNGFNITAAVPQPDQRDKFIEVPWHLNQLKKGRWGGHFGIHFYEFNKNFVIPQLLQEPEI